MSARAIARLLADPVLRAQLAASGIATAADYAWELRIDALERFLEEAATHRPSLDSAAVPEIRKQPR